MNFTAAQLARMHRPAPESRKWTVGFQYCERRFTSEPMPRAIAEQIQDSIESELCTTAWLDDAGPR